MLTKKNNAWKPKSEKRLIILTGGTKAQGFSEQHLLNN